MIRKLITAFLVARVSSLKILVAGDQHNTFFENVALHVQSSGEHSVYKLSRYLDPIFKAFSKDNIVLYGIGTHADKFLSANETENYFDQMQRYDLELYSIYFGQQPMLMELRKQGFDLGIGGCGYADSYLFRHMRIPYLKICEEDIESYQMQFLGMPVYTSYYPSIQSPNHDDKSSVLNRIVFCMTYQMNKLWIYKHKLSLAEKFNFFYDQIWSLGNEDALIIGQGSEDALFQSIMLKPANIKNVFPVVPAQHIQVSKSDLTLLLLDEGQEIFAEVARRLEDTQIAVTKLVYSESNATSILQNQPFTVNVQKETKLIIVGRCSQANLLSGVLSKAFFIGIDTNQREQYNCQKLVKHGVGKHVVQSAEQLYDTILQTYSDQQRWNEFQETVELHRELLEQTSKSQLSLEYWIQYVHKFGPTHLTPEYDGAVIERDLDLLGFAVLFLVLLYCFIRYASKKQPKTKTD